MTMSTPNRDAELSTLSNAASLDIPATPFRNWTYASTSERDAHCKAKAQRWWSISGVIRQAPLSLRGNTVSSAGLVRRGSPKNITVLLISVGSAAFTAHAIAAEPLRMLSSEAATEQSSYEARHNRRGVRDEDPNIYVYTPEFGRRFQMPLQWASDELKGADAVAFRVVPTYKTCGWGGDRKACREDEVRCDLDVYFDHQRNPLPWDERMRATDMDFDTTSQWFIGNSANRVMRPQTSLLGGPPLPRSPFTDPNTGEELGWQDWHGNSAGGWTGIRAYDREMFSGVSLVTFGSSCTSPAR